MRREIRRIEIVSEVALWEIFPSGVNRRPRIVVAVAAQQVVNVGPVFAPSCHSLVLD